jgi:hypothetical protein
MLLLQETYPIPAETGAIDDLVIAAILIGIFLFYILLCVLVGRYAKKHSRSFWGFFILSLILSPFWGFIIAIIAGGETAKQRERRIRQEMEIRMQMENQYRQQYYSQNPPPMPNSSETNQV